MCSFLFVPVALLLLFTYYPAVKLLQLSISDWDGYSPEYGYVGLRHYAVLLQDPEMWRTFANNGAYLAISLIQCVIGLYLAIILNGSVRLRRFFRASIFLPYILNGVAIAFMFSFLYDYDRGLLNVLLRETGFESLAIRWLSESYFSNISLALIGLWRYTGLMMVMYLGALQSIPGDLFEAAEIDGASYGHKIRYIVLPGLLPVIELTLFISINGALQAYFEPFVVTKGGPAGATSTFVTKTIDIAFQYSDFGKASAMGVLLLLIAMILFGIQRKLIRRMEAAHG
jgi:multiple sugar transport system permease protein